MKRSLKKIAGLGGGGCRSKNQSLANNLSVHKETSNLRLALAL